MSFNSRDRHMPGFQARIKKDCRGFFETHAVTEAFRFFLLGCKPADGSVFLRIPVGRFVVWRYAEASYWVTK